MKPTSEWKRKHTRTGCVAPTNRVGISELDRRALNQPDCHSQVAIDYKVCSSRSKKKKKIRQSINIEIDPDSQVHR